VRIAKTGSTGFFKRLQAWATTNNRTVLGSPAVHGLEAQTLPIWQALHPQGETWDILQAPVHFHDYMREPIFWTHPPVFVVSMVRSPFSRLVSAYRYMQQCCGEGDLEWCAPACTVLDEMDFEAYALEWCQAKASTSSFCETEANFFLGDSSTPMQAVDRFVLWRVY
jgi:hypothetical protein